MSFVLLCKWLLVSLLVFSAGGKLHGVNKASTHAKPSARDRHSKLKLPGRTVVVPAKKEGLVTTAKKSFRKMSNHLLETAKTVSKTASLLNRDIKAYFSSDFEVLLLRMTAPTDVKTSPVDVSRFIATTDTFIYNSDILSESNTYRVTLRKLWAKIAEKDVRTSLKALHLLHTLLVNSKPRSAALYQKLVHKMRKQFDQKTRTKYFDAKILQRDAVAVSEEDRPLIVFAQAFFRYILARSENYTADFDELSAVGYKAKVKTVIAEVRMN